jgi:hypothetical protein
MKPLPKCGDGYSLAYLKRKMDEAYELGYNDCLQKFHIGIGEIAKGNNDLEDPEKQHAPL